MNTLTSIYSQTRSNKKSKNCIFWLDATDNTKLTMNSSNVTQWIDKTRSYIFSVQNNSHATKTTVNGKQFLNFTSGGRYYNSGIRPSTQNHTVFAVGYTTKTSYTYGFGYIIGLPADLYWFFGVGPAGGFGGSPANRFGSFYSDGASWGAGNTNLVPYSNNFDATSLCIMCNTNNNTSAGNIPYFNGSMGTAKSGLTGNYNTWGIAIGYAPTNSANQDWGGYIGEILMYNRVLTTQERQPIEGYLAWKWGIQTKLPTNHPYYSVQPSSSVVDL
jgi:hypothetical protein